MRARRALALAVTLALGAALAAAVPARTRAAPDTKPYDTRLMRLAEILGAVHYLRELCGANEGQIWRDRMKELIDAEGSSPLRRARLTKSFNLGYSSYSRTYNSCTPSARTAIARFMQEGTELADAMVRTVP